MTKTARNYQEFDNFCAVFCIFVLLVILGYFFVFMRCSVGLFWFLCYDKTITTPQ